MNNLIWHTYTYPANVHCIHSANENKKKSDKLMDIRFPVVFCLFYHMNYAVNFPVGPTRSVTRTNRTIQFNPHSLLIPVPQNAAILTILYAKHIFFDSF